MFARFSRSWALIRASGAVLRQDKELLLFPIFAAIAALLKKTWGENIIGNAGMGFVFALFYIAVIGIGMGFAVAAAQTGSATLVALALAVPVLTLVAIALVHTALQGVYSAALYRYATDGNAGAAFSGALLGEAFRPKR